MRSRSAWQRRFPPGDARVLLQWANRCSRAKDPYFWLSLLPLVGALVGLAYGLVVFRMPRLVGLLLLILAGLALVQFFQRWGLHYENCLVTDAGLARVFPQREVPGIVRLLPLLQAMFPRPRFLPWTRVRELRRVAGVLQFSLDDGAQVSLALRPLRVVRGKRVLDVGRPRGGGKVVQVAEALDLIEREIRRAHQAGQGDGAAASA